jgi:hypothetical protein
MQASSAAETKCHKPPFSRVSEPKNSCLQSGSEVIESQAGKIRFFKNFCWDGSSGLTAFSFRVEMVHWIILGVLVLRGKFILNAGIA